MKFRLLVSVEKEKEKLNLLAPFLRPSLELSNAAFVINLKAVVNAPDAAKPHRKDCNIKNHRYQHHR